MAASRGGFLGAALRFVGPKPRVDCGNGCGFSASANAPHIALFHLAVRQVDRPRPFVRVERGPDHVLNALVFHPRHRCRRGAALQVGIMTQWTNDGQTRASKTDQYQRSNGPLGWKRTSAIFRSRRGALSTEALVGKGAPTEAASSGARLRKRRSLKDSEGGRSWIWYSVNRRMHPRPPTEAASWAC
jgi:hypothetical protein